MLKEAIARLMDRQDLDRAEISGVFEEIFSGHATSAQIAGFLVALRMKGETAGELEGFARAMREKSTRVDPGLNGAPLLDTCGTGGTGTKAFNISTVAAFVVAGAGTRVVSRRAGATRPAVPR